MIKHRAACMHVECRMSLGEKKELDSRIREYPTLYRVCKNDSVHVV